MNTSRLVGVAGIAAAALAFAMILASSAGGDAPADAPPLHTPTSVASQHAIVPPADHHMHVWSPDAVELLRRMQEETDEEAIPLDQVRPLTAANAVAALDSAGIRRGVILSTAYFFGTPLMDVEDEEARVRAENDYVARQVALHPERLTGFFSVNPLAGYAFDEIERCAEKPELTGLKLHMGNSDLDLEDPDHVKRLSEVFQKSDRLGLPIVIHLKNPRAAYGRRAVETFVEEVLPSAPDVPVQVAHLAGDGGFDEATREAVDAFAAAIEDRPEVTRRLFFDYSATPIPTALARGDSALLERVHEMNRMVMASLRKIAPERLVYGSDWPAISAPVYLGIRSSLDLDEEELAALLEGAAPYLP
ncbi:MAG: amidohydrolase family protein [Gemmatimonadota bacterium]|nr:amidohydrolase family protein [Gemmatimonadota bacterium]